MNQIYRLWNMGFRGRAKIPQLGMVHFEWSRAREAEFNELILRWMAEDEARDPELRIRKDASADADVRTAGYNPWSRG